MTTVYERLKALQIALPDVPVPVVAGYDAAFVPFVRAWLDVAGLKTLKGAESEPFCVFLFTPTDQKSVV